MGHDVFVNMPNNNEKVPRVDVQSLHDEEESRPTLKVSGRRKTAPMHGNPVATGIGYDGELNTVNTLGKIYTRIRDANVVTRNLIYIVPVSFILAIPLVIYATVKKDARADGIRLLGIWIWIQVMWWSFWITKLLAQIVPYLFQFVVGFVSSGTRKYRLLIKAMEIPIAFELWTIVCYASVPLITVFDPQLRDHVAWVKTFQRFMLASMAVAACFVAQKLIVQLITVNYHRRQFNFRVGENKLKVRMLEALLEVSLREFPLNSHPFELIDFEMQTGVDSEQSAANNALFGRAAMFSENLQTTVGGIASEITGAKSTQSSTIHNMLIEALDSKKASEALGRRLGISLVEEGKDALYLPDLQTLLGEGRSEEAMEMFNLIDQDRNGDISIDEMVMATQEIQRERKAIAKSMHDVGQAVRVLDRLLFFFTLIVLGVVYASFFSASFAKYMFTVGTQIASVSFAIAATVQEFLGSCIFVFVKHPYDVGDMVIITDVRMVVEHISLLYTTFKRVDNGRLIQIPNIINNNNWIDNISRSKQMKEQIEIQIHAESSFSDIEVFRAELMAFLTHPDNKRDFRTDVEVQIMDCKDMKQIDLMVGVSHKSNWANEELRLLRRNKLMTAILTCLRTVPIYPVGADKPISILKTDAELVARARELIKQDQDALQVLRDREEIDAQNVEKVHAQQPDSFDNSMSTAIDSNSLRIETASLRGRSSIDSRRSYHGVGGGRYSTGGARRRSHAPDGTE